MEVTLGPTETRELLARGAKAIRIGPDGVGVFDNGVLVQTYKAMNPTNDTSFRPVEVSKAMTPAQRSQASQEMLDDIMAGVRDIMSGRTRTLEGNEARIALRIGAKPVKPMGGGAYQFRVKDLTEAAKNVGPSEKAMLDLESWYLTGR